MPATAPVILVVEDEIIIRMDVVEQLEGKGYTVIGVGDAHEAIETLSSAERVDLLFTDVNMPGDLNGLRLAHEVARAWPQTGIIVTSGKNAIPQDELPDAARFYPKPYEASTIHAAIGEMLDH